jgi:hypothetical protein
MNAKSLIICRGLIQVVRLDDMFVYTEYAILAVASKFHLGPMYGLGGGVNTTTLLSLFFNCLAFSALSATSAIMPIVTNTEKITATIDGITIMTNFPEFIIYGRSMTYYKQISFCYGLLEVTLM